MARSDLLWGVDRRRSVAVLGAAPVAAALSYVWFGLPGAAPSVRLWSAVLLAAFGALVAGFGNRGVVLCGLLPVGPAVAFALSGMGRPYVDDPDLGAPALLIAFGLGLAAGAAGAGVRRLVWETDA